MLGPTWSNFPKWMNQYVTYFLWTVKIFGMQNIQSCEKGNKQYKLSKEIELTFKIRVSKFRVSSLFHYRCIKLTSLQRQLFLLPATVSKNCCSTHIKSKHGIHLLLPAFPCTVSAAKYFWDAKYLKETASLVFTKNCSSSFLLCLIAWSC